MKHLTIQVIRTNIAARHIVFTGHIIPQPFVVIPYHGTVLPISPPAVGIAGTRGGPVRIIPGRPVGPHKTAFTSPV